MEEINLTEEEMILYDELFRCKALLQLPNKDEKTKEELIQRINDIRTQLAEMKFKQMSEQRREESVIRNGKF